MDDILKVLKSLVSDIEAMQWTPGSDEFGTFDGALVHTTEGDQYKIEWPNLAISLQHAKEVLFVNEHEALHKETQSRVKHEYAFDVELKSVVRVRAYSEAEARELLNHIESVELDHELDLEDRDVDAVTITEVSLQLNEEENANLFEVDGVEPNTELVPDLPPQGPWATPRGLMKLAKRDKVEPTYQLEASIDAWVEWAERVTKENAPPKE
jgi:hypothetical protein